MLTKSSDVIVSPKPASQSENEKYIVTHLKWNITVFGELAHISNWFDGYNPRSG